MNLLVLSTQKGRGDEETSFVVCLPVYMQLSMYVFRCSGRVLDENEVLLVTKRRCSLGGGIALKEFFGRFTSIFNIKSL